MAGLMKTRRIYYIQFVNSKNTPSRRLISLGTSRKVSARGKFVKLEDAYHDGSFDPWIDDASVILIGRSWHDVGVMEASGSFIEQKDRNHRSENTIRTYREVLSLFRRRNDKRLRLSSITPSQSEAFVYDSPISKATQFKRFGHLRTFFRFCVRERYIKRSPLARVEVPDKPHKLPKAITRTELNLICDYLWDDYTSKLEKRQLATGELICKLPH